MKSRIKQVLRAAIPMPSVSIDESLKRDVFFRRQAHKFHEITMRSFESREEKSYS